MDLEGDNADQFTNFDKNDNAIDASIKQSDDPNPFEDDETDKDMGDGAKDLADIFDANRQEEDFDYDQSIHPLTMKGNEG